MWNLYQYVQELDEEDRMKEMMETENSTIREMHDFGREVSPSHVRRAPKEDPVVAEVRTWVQQKKKPSKEDLKGKDDELQHFAQIADALLIKDDILYYPYKLNHLGE